MRSVHPAMCVTITHPLLSCIVHIYAFTSPPPVTALSRELYFNRDNVRHLFFFFPLSPSFPLPLSFEEKLGLTTFLRRDTAPPFRVSTENFRVIVSGSATFDKKKKKKKRQAVPRKSFLKVGFKGRFLRSMMKRLATTSENRGAVVLLFIIGDYFR